MQVGRAVCVCVSVRVLLLQVARRVSLRYSALGDPLKCDIARNYKGR